MNKISILFFGVFLLLGSHVNAQDTLTFLNGKVVVGKVTDSHVLNTQIEITKKQKVKSKSFESTDIFDIRYANGDIDTLYAINEELEYFLTPLEMHHFILGEQDARNYFKPKLNSLGGIAFGGVFGYLLNEGAYVAAVPLVFTIASGVSPVKIKNTNNRSSDILAQPAYQEGFIKVARIKKSFHALAGSTVGTFLGVLIANETK